MKLSGLLASLTLRTVVALSVALVAGFVFLEVTEEVIEGDATDIDRSLSLWLHALDTPALDVVMRAFTGMGSAPAVASVVAVVAAVSAMRRRTRALGGALVAVTLAATALDVLFKLLVHRTRPDIFSEIVAPASFSFPSGHAMVSSAAYGMVAIVVARMKPSLRWPVYLGAGLLVLGIGVSRVYLGVHWASDVLAGFAAGGMLVAGGVLALRPIPAAAERR